MLDELWRDVRYAGRSLARRPGFSAVAVLVLAVGIGVNSAVFSLVNMVALRPVNVVEPDRLVGVYARSTERPDDYRAFSYPTYADLRDADEAFAELAAYTVSIAGVRDGDDTRRVMAGLVSANYFDAFGVPPARGRGFLPEEERPGAAAAVTSLLGYDETRGREVYRQVVGRVRELPGVEAAGASSLVPFGAVTTTQRVRRRGDADDESAVSALEYVVGDDYFAALGLPVLRGRAFTAAEAESADGPRVAVVDEPLAHLLWPEGDALGQLLQPVVAPPAEAPPPLQVVGVVPGVRHQLWDDEPGPHLYLPFGQHWVPNMHVHARLVGATPAVEAATLAAIREEVRAVDPRLPILTSKTLRDHRDDNGLLWITAAGAKLFAALGGLALLLAVVGVYGVKSYVMSRRTREIGVRMALGASPGVVRREMLREGLALTLAGLGVGVVLAAGVARLLASMLYDVRPGDPLVFTAAAAVLAAAALAAAYLPVRRASRVAPTEALRYE